MSTKKEPVPRKRQREGWKPSFPYEVNYNDHFETPEVAYREILPLLDFLCRTKRDEHVLYDPYYCNGRTAVVLQGLGFSRVVHECRDFYADVASKSIPNHHTLITNPPYSDDHKKKCLSFVLEQLRANQKPFFLLMPNYVAARDYYRQLLRQHDQEGDIVYVLPSTPYEYSHPEGTGHDSSPFESMWYCGIGSDKVATAQEYWSKYYTSRTGARLVTSLQTLAQLKAIPTEKRPNPKQRRKFRRQMQTRMEVSQADTPKQPPAAKKKRTNRYRNVRGERTKKRF